MLKWTSESEYFLSFENFFADTIYHIQSKSNHFTPSAAHARRGVITLFSTTRTHDACLSHVELARAHCHTPSPCTLNGEIEDN